jgi:outer membrane immunogenic protein
MRSLLVAAFAAVLGAGLPAAYAAPPVAPSSYDWNGIYFGAHATGGWAWDQWSIQGASVNPIGTGTASGALAGLQAGGNWQLGSFVFGLQGDFDVGGLKGTAGRSDAHSNGFLGYGQTPYPGNCWSGGDQTATCGTAADWLASLTARAGVLARPDTLLYLKGGLAFAHDSFSVTALTPGGGCGYLYGSAGPDYAPVGQSRFGTTVGGGVEHAFNHQVTLFAEYDYSDFGNQAVNFADTGNGCSPAFTAQIKQTVQEVKVGLNVHY